jgi:hypothetical protein
MGTKKNLESSSKEKKRESRERAKVRAEAAIAKAETTNESQFKELLDMLEGMPPERGLTPWYDVSDASVAAYRLYEAGNAVRDKFERLLAVKPGLLDTLDLLVKVAGALSYIRMQLLEAQGTEDDVTVPKDLLARADDVRNRMIEVLEYVLGKDPIIAAALAFIRQGTGHQDRIQDLALLIKYYRDRAAGPRERPDPLRRRRRPPSGRVRGRDRRSPPTRKGEAVGALVRPPEPSERTSGGHLREGPSHARLPRRRTRRRSKISAPHDGRPSDLGPGAQPSPDGDRRRAANPGDERPRQRHGRRHLIAPPPPATRLACGETSRSTRAIATHWA